jgi:hypothetical protein
MFLIILTYLNIMAQTVNITGKVTNGSGKGISGAVVKLASKSITAVTDVSGTYSIKGTTAVNETIKHLSSGMILLKNDVITVNITQPERIQIELFDIQGNLLNTIISTHSSAGNYRFNLNNNGLAAGMVMVRVIMGQHKACFRYIPSCRSSGGAQLVNEFADGRIAKLEAIVDSLQVSAAGYVSKIVKITSYSAVIDISLDSASCKATASKPSGNTISGSGPHEVVIETNSDPGIKSGTIYRPTDLGPGKNYPIFVWGEGACAQDGLSNKAAMGEIASWGYFIVADGSSAGGGGTAAAMIAYITWAIEQNGNPCSAYYQSLDTTKIAADGFSCGGLMAENASYDLRFTAIGFTSSGLINKDTSVYNKIHTPFKIMNGGPKNAGNDMAYDNGLRDYNEISALGKPIIYISKTSAGHGGDLDNGKGDFNTVNLAWLNWQLKGDTTATGKALLVGPNCRYCKNSGWDFKSANWP